MHISVEWFILKPDSYTYKILVTNFVKIRAQFFKDFPEM